MKRIISILFICVHLFNLVGYKILFEYFISQTNEYTVQELDSGNYNDSELIEIKVPLNLPYYTSLDEYERYDGEIELNGIHYNFVKRKVYSDTLYMLCLPNHVKTELYKAKNEFAAKETNSSSSKNGIESLEKKSNFEKEYNQQEYLKNYLFVLLVKPKKYFDFPHLTTCFIPPPVKPPQVTG